MSDLFFELPKYSVRNLKYIFLAIFLKLFNKSKSIKFKLFLHFNILLHKMEGQEEKTLHCPCEKSSCPKTDDSMDRQQMLLSQPELWNQRKTDASLRVFTTVMLHTWRQRRKEVRELQQVVQRLQCSVGSLGPGNLIFILF